MPICGNKKNNNKSWRAYTKIWDLTNKKSKNKLIDTEVKNQKLVMAILVQKRGLKNGRPFPN